MLGVARVSFICAVVAIAAVAVAPVVAAKPPKVPPASGVQQYVETIPTATGVVVATAAAAKASTTPSSSSPPTATASGSSTTTTSSSTTPKPAPTTTGRHPTVTVADPFRAAGDTSGGGLGRTLLIVLIAGAILVSGVAGVAYVRRRS